MSQPGDQVLVPFTDYPELAQIVDIHRGLFGGFTMTATAPEGQGQQQEPDGQDGAQNGQQPAGQSTTTSQAQAANGQQQAQESDADKIARLERELTAARGEAGKERVNAKTAAADAARNELVQQLGKALGLVKDDTPTDPKELQQQIASVGTENTSLKGENSNLKTQLAALLSAVNQGANPVALLDSNNFLRSLEGLAPTDTDKINEAIKKALETNPTLKATQAVVKSGPELNGGTGGQAKPKTLEEAIAAKLGAAAN